VIIPSPEFVAGVRAERKARGEWLARVQTWHEDKSDAWLEGYEAGVLDERERIIKLVEGIDYLSDCCFQPDCCVTTGELIALIKGENK
jgi:hypothetical protein